MTDRAAPGGSCADIRAGPCHTFCKGPRLREIKPPRIERIERIERMGLAKFKVQQFLLSDSGSLVPDWQALIATAASDYGK